MRDACLDGNDRPFRAGMASEHLTIFPKTGYA